VIIKSNTLNSLQIILFVGSPCSTRRYFFCCTNTNDLFLTSGRR